MDNRYSSPPMPDHSKCSHGARRAGSICDKCFPDYRTKSTAAIAAENERLREALRAWERHAIYPVCTSIAKRGYGWMPEETLDYVLGLTRAALDGK